MRTKPKAIELKNAEKDLKEKVEEIMKTTCRKKIGQN